MADDEDGDGRPDLISAWVVVCCIVGAFAVFVTAMLVKGCA